MAMREKALSTKTLVCFLQGLQGKVIRVEFRDSSFVQGEIDSVDGYMNIEMSDVVYTAASGVEREFSKYCCQGKFIRFADIPKEVNPIKTIEDRLEVLRRIRPGRGGRGRGGRGGGRGRGGFRRGSGGGGSYGQRPSFRGGSSGGYRDRRY